MADYFKKKHLIEFGEGKFGEDAAEYWKNFMNYYGNVMAEGELTSREKALIALAVAHSEACPYCPFSVNISQTKFGFRFMS